MAASDLSSILDRGCLKLCRDRASQRPTFCPERRKTIPTKLRSYQNNVDKWSRRKVTVSFQFMPVACGRARRWACGPGKLHLTRSHQSTIFVTCHAAPCCVTTPLQCAQAKHHTCTNSIEITRRADRCCDSPFPCLAQLKAAGPLSPQVLDERQVRGVVAGRILHRTLQKGEPFGFGRCCNSTSTAPPATRAITVNVHCILLPRGGFACAAVRSSRGGTVRMKFGTPPFLLSIHGDMLH